MEEPVRQHSQYQYEIVREGRGLETPNVGSICEVTIVGRLDENKECIVDLRYENDSNWQIGEGDSEFYDAVDYCLQSMHKGDICKLQLQSGEAWHILKAEGIEINEDAVIEYEIYLKDFQNVTNTWLLTVEEKLNKAKRNKERGVDLYKKGNIDAAARRFSVALQYLITMQPEKIQSQEDNSKSILILVSQLRKTCYLNLANCQARYKMYDYVIANCSKVLNLDCNNVKALYRRGVTYTACTDIENAKADLELARNLEPNNKAIIAALQELKKITRTQTEHYRKALGIMFRGKSDKL